MIVKDMTLRELLEHIVPRSCDVSVGEYVDEIHTMDICTVTMNWCGRPDGALGEGEWRRLLEKYGGREVAWVRESAWPRYARIVLECAEEGE